MQLRRLCGISIFAVLALVAPSSGHSQTHITEADDAYHFKTWQGTPYNAFYTEWWYFNLYDAKHDLQAIFSYQVIDPANLTSHGFGQIAVVTYQGSQIVTDGDLYPLTLFSASDSKANVQVGANGVSVLGPNTYLITGSTLDGRLSWNLFYDREAAPWFAGDHVQVAPLPWEQMSWLLYMPRARVSGTLTIDGHTYSVDCSGYHDHNWGQWDFTSVIWNWAQYSEPGLTFDLGDFVGNPNGRASISVLGQRVVFGSNQYQLVHTQWAFDAKNNLSYPTESVLTANNGVVELSVTMRVQKTEPLGSGPPPSLVIYEQPTRFTGYVKFHNPWLPIEIPFQGDGFKEYTAATRATP